jgi:hypothetical protein
MRISVEQTDAGYDNFLRYGKGVIILINGEKNERCITAHEELGIAKCYVVDENGKLVMDGLAPRTEWVKGDIKVVVNS